MILPTPADQCFHEGDKLGNLAVHESYTITQTSMLSRLSPRMLFSTIRRVRIPDRIRNGRFKTVFDFYSNLFGDYYHVSQDVIQDAKDFPFKASIIGCSLASLFVAYKTAPTENDFYEQLNSCNDEMGLVDASVRNNSSYQHLYFLNEVRNQRVLRCINFTFLSLMLINDYPKDCGHYYSQCTYLKPIYRSYVRDRIVDVGIFGRWRIIDHRVKDFDICSDEWFGNNSDNKHHGDTKIQT